jgi:hypothetical protein
MSDPHLARLFGGLLRRWFAATFTIDLRSLALFRIGLGGILVADSLLRTRDFHLMFAPDGIFPIETLTSFHNAPSLWSLAFLIDASWWGGMVLALEGLAGAALAVGFQTRLATILGWVALVSVIRRTSPATNAGDIWLACQLFWAMFLPLGARWSLDAARAASRHSTPSPPPAAVSSIASAALVLQVVAVYLGAGLSKCNASWFAGDALAHALSVHDHGTPLGTLLGSTPWIATPLQWGVLLGEIGMPLVMLALPRPQIRGTIVALFITFHITIWMLMSVGLFAAIGIVAWLPLIPAVVWPAEKTSGGVAGLGRATSGVCGLAGVLAVVAFLHHATPLRAWLLPQSLAAAINLTCLPQAWAMFGGVPAQEQWVYGRALLADGTLVDLLRNGRPLQAERPVGGFTTLPHHRWHKFFWILPKSHMRVFGPPAAAALARDWNDRHAAHEQVVLLEIRFGMQGVREGDGTVRDALIASWPARSSTGSGNLEMFLEATDRGSPPNAPSQEPMPVAARPE